MQGELTNALVEPFSDQVLDPSSVHSSLAEQDYEKFVASEWWASNMLSINC